MILLKIIFIATTGVHHALVAANIYLGKLNKPEFQDISGFCDNSKDISGYPIVVDDSNQTVQVYTLGVSKHILLATKSIEQLVELLGYTSQDLIVKPVFIKGEKVLAFIAKIPGILGGNFINHYVSNIILKREFNNIYNDITDFRAQLEQEELVNW